MENDITEINLRGIWENSGDGALQRIRFGVANMNYEVETNFLFQIDVYNGGASCGAACDNFAYRVPLTTGGAFSGGDTLPQEVVVYPVENLTAFLDANYPLAPFFLGPVQRTLNLIEEKTSASVRPVRLRIRVQRHAVQPECRRPLRDD